MSTLSSRSVPCRSPTSVNSLENHWLPFTANRDFKADPRLLVKAEGVYYWNHKGGKLIDGSSGLFCCAAGHGRKEIADAVYKSMLEIDYTPHFQVAHPSFLRARPQGREPDAGRSRLRLLLQLRFRSDRYRHQDRARLSPQPAARASASASSAASAPITASISAASRSPAWCATGRPSAR